MKVTVGTSQTTLKTVVDAADADFFENIDNRIIGEYDIKIKNKDTSATTYVSIFRDVTTSDFGLDIAAGEEEVFSVPKQKGGPAGDSLDQVKLISSASNANIHVTISSRIG